jgi:hypothetical protein
MKMYPSEKKVSSRAGYTAPDIYTSYVVDVVILLYWWYSVCYPLDVDDLVHVRYLCPVFIYMAWGLDSHVYNI